MRICRIQIKNFRNFQEFDVILDSQAVILGENKIGKSNLLYALRLVLDPSLPDSVRQLQRTDFWDGLGNDFFGKIIEVSVDLTDFEDNDNIMAVLAEHIVSVEPLVSRLTYAFQPKPIQASTSKSDIDYEFITYGAGRPDNKFGYSVRSRLPLEILPALRDAERDLSTWNNSPLKPLLDDAVALLDEQQLQNAAKAVLGAQREVLDISASNLQGLEQQNSTSAEQPEQPLRNLETRIARRHDKMVGVSQSLSTALGFSPTDPAKLIRAIRLFIDNGERSIADASLGSANVLYLTLKSLNLELLAEREVRDHTFLAIEEPEAHLHPHLQRLVYRDFLKKRIHQIPGIENGEVAQNQSILLTTHSPHIVSVSPLKSIVLLRKSNEGDHTIGVSAANLDMSEPEIEDIERYLDINRGEMLFSKGVLLVEGDAEEYIIPIFAHLLGYDLDELSISICSVSGTNFSPYVKLLCSRGLNIPFATITDLDPQENAEPLGHKRVLDLLNIIDIISIRIR